MDISVIYYLLRIEYSHQESVQKSFILIFFLIFILIISNSLISLLLGLSAGHIFYCLFEVIPFLRNYINTLFERNNNNEMFNTNSAPPLRTMIWDLICHPMQLFSNNNNNNVNNVHTPVDTVPAVPEEIIDDEPDT